MKVLGAAGIRVGFAATPPEFHEHRDGIFSVVLLILQDSALPVTLSVIANWLYDHLPKRRSVDLTLIAGSVQSELRYRGPVEGLDKLAKFDIAKIMAPGGMQE